MAGKINIAIDGPAASGKSTTARLLAKRLGYIYIDTGAMYRAATLYLLRHAIDINDEPAVSVCVEQHPIRIFFKEGEQRTFVDEEDVTELLRDPQINRVISVVSSYPVVRKVMVREQRKLAEHKGVVMDGRDIGTVVLPDAELKVFMVASLDQRAQRRLKELQSRGLSVSIDEIKEEIAQRDRLDSKREQSPLLKAEDARELDTSGLTVEEQVTIIYNWALEIISK